MKIKQNTLSSKQLGDIIDVIRSFRNNLIKDFLDERVLTLYLSQQFRNIELSAFKAECIRKDLKNLLIAPVNIELYNVIIEDYKTTGNTTLSKGSEKLFYREIDKVLNTYLY
jgi:hypothetical protein